MMTLEDKNKKKKEQQQNTPTTPAQPEQTTTPEQPQQPQGPVLWKTKDEEVNVDEGVFKDYLGRQQQNDIPISAAEDKYLTSMNNIYNLLNKNSEKTKTTLKKQPVADAFNMLGTAVGKLSEVASNATFGGRVAPKKVDSSDIAKQGNALLKKTYELPQYLQAIDSEMLQNEAKKLQNDYSIKMNRLQRQQQYLQNAYKLATTKTEKEYLSAEAYQLKQQEIDAEKKYKEGMLELKKQENGLRKLGIYANSNKGNGNGKFDKLTINGVDYPAPDNTVYEIATKSDLFTDKELEIIEGLEPSVIRGEIQKKFDQNKFPKYYKPKYYRDGKKTSFPLMTILRTLAKTQRNN